MQKYIPLANHDNSVDLEIPGEGWSLDDAVYKCSDVDAREAQHIAIDRAQKAKIERLEKLLREVYEHGENTTLHSRIGVALGLSD
jgi:hypothetical protein